MRKAESLRSRRTAAIALGGLALLAASLGQFVRRWRRAKGVRMAADIKDISRKLFEEPWKGNFDVIDQYVDASYLGYDPTEPEPLRGPEGFKRQIQQYLAAFPDARITVEEQIAEGDVVSTRWKGRGTHQGNLMGITPTGKQVTVSGIALEKYKKGKLIESWNNWDALGMLQQLGAIPAMATA